MFDLTFVLTLFDLTVFALILYFGYAINTEQWIEQSHNIPEQI